METLEERFRAKVRKTGGCWLWVACKTSGGYGLFSRSGKMVYAHRLSWELHNGPIPEGLCVLHKCDVHGCVNPQHLFLGTQADNVADMISKGRSADHRGDAHGNAKLTVDAVLAIRSRQGQTQRSLAKEFGVSRVQISRTLSGQRWAHLPVDCAHALG